MSDLIFGGGTVVEVVDPFPVEVVAAPPVVTEVVVVPVAGPPGAPGESAGALTPADIETISDNAAADVLIDLEPPVDLTLLFENALI